MDLATAQANLDLWLEAQKGLADNASYTLTFPSGQSRTLTRQSVAEVLQMIAYWDRTVAVLRAHSSGSRNPHVATPVWR